MAQGFRSLTKAGEKPEAGVGTGDSVEAGAQQWRPAVEIAGLDEYNSFETRGEIIPGRKAVLSRMVEQHFRVTFCRGQISHPQREQAAAVGQGVTQRGRVGE